MFYRLVFHLVCYVVFRNVRVVFEFCWAVKSLNLALSATFHSLHLIATIFAQEHRGVDDRAKVSESRRYRARPALGRADQRRQIERTFFPALSGGPCFYVTEALSSVLRSLQAVDRGPEHDAET